MRIISQDRKVDIPYDNAIIKINDAAQIITLIGERFVCLGSYKSLEDAQVVMRDIANNRMSYYLMPKEDKIDINGDRK